MSENGELIKPSRARAILRCSYPRLQGYVEAGELEPVEDEDGKTVYRLADVEALAASNSDIDASVTDAVGQVTRMIRGFEKNVQELLKLAIDPIKLTLAQWEKLNDVNSTSRKSLEDENQRLRDKYHGVLVKLEELLDGEARRKLEEDQARASEKRKDDMLAFVTEKAGPTLMAQLEKTIAIKTKAQPLLDLVDRMRVDQMQVLFQMGMIDLKQVEALCALKGIKVEDITNVNNTEVSGSAGQTSGNGGGDTASPEG